MTTTNLLVEDAEYVAQSAVQRRHAACRPGAPVFGVGVFVKVLDYFLQPENKTAIVTVVAVLKVRQVRDNSARRQCTKTVHEDSARQYTRTVSQLLHSHEHVTVRMLL